MTAFPADWRQRIEAMLARAEDADALDLIETWIAGDALAHIVVGDPDPTGYHLYDTDECQVHWPGDYGDGYTFLWQCSRQRGHPGQHIAGGDDQVMAVKAATA